MALDYCKECGSIESFKTKLKSASNNIDYMEVVECTACGADEDSRKGIPEHDDRDVER